MAQDSALLRGGDLMITLNINKSVFNDAYYPYLMDYSNRYEVYY